METPILEDVLGPGLRAVICGTAAGTRSAERKAYYAGRGNQFWTVLGQVGLTLGELKPEHFRSLAKLGLGLTDIAKMVSGVDAKHPLNAFDVEGFTRRIRLARPGVVAFNGKKAAEVFYDFHKVAWDRAYGSGPAVSSFPTIVVLPSTSGNARRYWSAEPWHDFARSIAAASQP